MVLGRGAQHRRPADVDVLDGVVVAAARPGGGRGKRIEVDDQQVDRLDAVFAHHLVVLPAPTEQAAVHLRVERLDPPVHDLRKARVACHLAYGEAGLPQLPGSASGREQFDTEFVELAGQVGDAGLVGYAQQRAADLGHLSLLPPKAVHDAARRRRRYSDKPYSRSFLRRVPRFIPRMVAARLWLPSA